jgi:hypothetical protein
MVTERSRDWPSQPAFGGEPELVDRDGDASDAAWNLRQRNETPVERLDRNWSDLLQELRVLQTGVQLLTGLLLTAAFQQRFTELSEYQRVVYLCAVALTTLSTAFLIAPVALHRVLFRQHARSSLVAAGQRCALAGLATLALAVTGVVQLIFSVVAGTAAGATAAGIALVAFGALWSVIPLAYRRASRPTSSRRA